MDDENRFSINEMQKNAGDTGFNAGFEAGRQSIIEEKQKQIDKIVKELAKQMLVPAKNRIQINLKVGMISALNFSLEALEMTKEEIDDAWVKVATEQIALKRKLKNK